LLAEKGGALLQAHAAILQPMHAFHVRLEAGLICKSGLANRAAQRDKVVNGFSSFRRVEHGGPFVVALVTAWK
jgi:hypothetical protein